MLLGLNRIRPTRGLVTAFVATNLVLAPLAWAASALANPAAPTTDSKTAPRIAFTSLTPRQCTRGTFKRYAPAD